MYTEKKNKVVLNAIYLWLKKTNKTLHRESIIAHYINIPETTEILLTLATSDDAHRWYLYGGSRFQEQGGRFMVCAEVLFWWGGVVLKTKLSSSWVWRDFFIIYFIFARVVLLWCVEFIFFYYVVCEVVIF